MGMSNVMKERRRALGMSQTRLAELVGVHPRQIARYEAGEQQPVLTVAAALARALDISLSDLAAEFDPVIDVSGIWWSAWEVANEGRRGLTVQEVRATQHNKTVGLVADQTRTAGYGSEGWRGEVRVYDNEVLVGSYRLAQEGPRSWGTMLLAVQPEFERALGCWIGQSPAGDVITGGAWLARDRGEVERLAVPPLDQP